jgi:subtilisin-like proprotein convertase family protein
MEIEMKYSRLPITLCLSVIFSLVFVQLPKARASEDASPLPTQSRVDSRQQAAPQNNQAVFTNPTPINIPAVGSATPYPSSIVVSGLSGTIPITPGSVNVNINNFSHTSPDDVGIVLVGPTGAALLLQDGAGDRTDIANVSYTLSDTALSRLPCNGELTIGIWYPTGCRFPGPTFPFPGPSSAYSIPGPAGGPATLASTFGGTNPNGTWNLFVIDSANGESGSIAGGWSLEIVTSGPPPVRATISDFDGDAKTDLAVFRPATGTWFIQYSSDQSSHAVQFGISTDIPVPGDFDGDRKTDIAVFRPSENRWYILNSSDDSVDTTVWGQSGDRPLASDYDGDGRADFITIRNSLAGAVWNIGISPERGAPRNPAKTIPAGTLRDSATPAFTIVVNTRILIILAIILIVVAVLLAAMVVDNDGDGKTDPTVWKASDGTWNQLRSTDGSFQSTAWGTDGDKPLMGDFDGDHKDDLTVFRPSQSAWYTLRSSDNSITAVQFGTASDTLVPADYDGDGKADVAVFRASTGTWHILQSSNGIVRSRQFGQSGDRPVPAEYVR